MYRKMADLFQKAQKMKAGISSVRARLKERHVEVSTPDVRVVASCDKQIVSIEIRSPLTGPELENTVAKAVNEALEKAEVVLKEEMEKAMAEAGIHLPGLF